MKLSIILPVYNEEKNLLKLFKELNDVFSDIQLDYEIICINDGSRDDSLNVLKSVAKNNSAVKVIDFKRNFGQTAAVSAGIKNAIGEIIIPMDSDLQNDPADISKFLVKIDEGYDMVSGWRKSRKDNLFSRKIPSVIANWLIGFITGVKLHDYGCSMKAYRRELIQEINLYGEMHRLIPVYVAKQGGKISEIEVNHRARLNGQSNYGLSRTFKVLLDLVVVMFLTRYMNRPIHFFGGIGFISLFLGVIAAMISVLLKIFHIRDFVATPLPVFSALLIIVGVQLIVIGVIAEMIMRVYYESQNKETYLIREKINFLKNG